VGPRALVAPFGARRSPSAAAAALYLAVSFCFFGLRVLPHFGSEFIGSGTDPQLFAWAFAWWPHALDAGANPVITHALWTPLGSDLAWATAIPGLALPLAPVTLLFGPIAAYNLAALLLPALSALGAFALCRQLTGTFWPALAGGYLYGFSSYLLGHELGHPHLTAAFVVPLAALVLLRFLDASLSPTGLVVRLGPLLALQFALSSEIFFTLTLALLLAAAAAALSAPARRSALRRLAWPLLSSYLVCVALVSPLLYYAVSDFQTGAVTPASSGGANLVTFAFPTGLTAIGGGLAQHFDPSIPIVSAEDGQYLGLPTLLIVAVFLWRRRRAPAGRFLALCFTAACLATLGSELRVRTWALFPLPWRLVQSLPLFDNVIPGRLALYVALLASVIVALFAASPGGSSWLSIGLVVLALLAIVPDLRLSVWHQQPEQPAFFAAKLERGCLRRGENTLLLPPPFRNEGLLWQAEDGFRFGVADAGLNAQLPAALPDRETAAQLVNNKRPHGGAAALLRFARAEGVGAILVDASSGANWRALLDPVLPERSLGGVDLYQLGPAPPGCGQA
jgi:hypothetical protein